MYFCQTVFFRFVEGVAGYVETERKKRRRQKDIRRQEEII